MIEHLTSADYHTMPWANGKGTTVEMLQVEQDGAVKWRLSRASVVESGPFSVFPGIARNLTVISGPGFALRGSGFDLQARPLWPVAFPGDVAISSEDVGAASDDFNVMTSTDLPLPEVEVVRQQKTFGAGGTLAIFALQAAAVNGQPLDRHDLVVTDQGAQVTGLAIVVRLFG